MVCSTEQVTGTGTIWQLVASAGRNASAVLPSCALSLKTNTSAQQELISTFAHNIMRSPSTRDIMPYMMLQAGSWPSLLLLTCSRTEAQHSCCTDKQSFNIPKV